MKTKEIFDRYLISSCGKLFIKSSNKEVKGCLNGRGYRITTITDGVGNRKTMAFHKLVALAFKENPHNFKEVDHKDGNKLNNSVDNLEWVTRGENIRRSYKLKSRSASGTNNANSIYSEEQIIEVCSLLSSKVPYKTIEEITGVKVHTIKLIKYKKQWREISKSYF